jgi:hypothetical protein
MLLATNAVVYGHVELSAVRTSRVHWDGGGALSGA